MPITEFDYYLIIKFLILYFIVCYSIDNILIISTGIKARWFKLHACYNMVIVGSTINDVYDILIDPSQGFNHQIQIHGSAVFILHLYHCIFFKLKPIDYYHHGISVFLPIMLIPSIPYKFVNLYYFNLCGLPGGIDYFALVLVKYNKMTKTTQKYYSSLTNAYIRIPLGIIACCFNYIAMLNQNNIKPYYSLLIMGFIIYSNVIYFGKLSIENYAENKQLTLKQG
tara:strand:+ start:4501 stop:5175 length:675 start_codon:yes stop_codon:yes gene_type:complete